MLGRGLSYDAPVTTFEAAAQSVLRRTSERLATRAQRRAQRATKAAMTGFAAGRRAVLQVAGLAGFTLAAWSVDFKLGLAIGAVCAFVLVWLLDSE